MFAFGLSNVDEASVSCNDFHRLILNPKRLRGFPFTSLGQACYLFSQGSVETERQEVGGSANWVQLAGSSSVLGLEIIVVGKQCHCWCALNPLVRHSLSLLCMSSQDSWFQTVFTFAYPLPLLNTVARAHALRQDAKWWRVAAIFGMLR